MRVSKKLIKLKVISVLLVEKLKEREVLVICSKAFFFKEIPIIHLKALYNSYHTSGALPARVNTTVIYLPKHRAECT